MKTQLFLLSDKNKSEILWSEVPRSVLRKKVTTQNIPDVYIRQWIQSEETNQAILALREVYNAKKYLENKAFEFFSYSDFTPVFDYKKRELFLPTDLEDYFNRSFPPLEKILEGYFRSEIAKDWLEDPETEEVMFSIKADYDLPTNAYLISYQDRCFYVFKPLLKDLESFLEKVESNYGDRNSSVKSEPVPCSRPYPSRSKDRCRVSYSNVPDNYISVSTDSIQSKGFYWQNLTSRFGDKKPLRHSPLRWATRKAWIIDVHKKDLKKIVTEKESLSYRSEDGIVWIDPVFKKWMPVTKQDAYSVPIETKNKHWNQVDLNEFLSEINIDIIVFDVYLSTDRAKSIVESIESQSGSRKPFDYSDTENRRAALELCKDFLDYLNPATFAAIAPDKFSDSVKNEFVTVGQMKSIGQSLINKEADQGKGCRIQVSSQGINKFLEFEGLQKKKGKAWIPTRKGSKYRDGEKWDIGLLDWFLSHIKEKSSRYLSQDQFIAEVIETVDQLFERDDITSQMINATTEVMGLQERFLYKGKYNRWIPTCAAFKQGKVLLQGSTRVIWSKDLVAEVSKSVVVLFPLGQKRVRIRSSESGKPSRLHQIRQLFTRLTGVKASKAEAIAVSCRPKSISNRSMKSVSDWVFAIDNIRPECLIDNSGVKVPDSVRCKEINQYSAAERLVWLQSTAVADAVAQEAVKQGLYFMTLSEIKSMNHCTEEERLRGISRLEDAVKRVNIFAFSV
ncbi:MAG: hypothetical protein F6K55_03250 [Moorea sp. SIO4A3]|nr:hypothetical protein [Moorena sp. SIO4A3]